MSGFSSKERRNAMAADMCAIALKGGRVVGFVALTLCSILLSISSASALGFEEFPAAKTYRGKPVAPNFKGPNKDFALLKSRIVEAMNEGVTFAGEFSVAEFGCGTGCTSVVVANNRTGQQKWLGLSEQFRAFG